MEEQIKLLKELQSSNKTALDKYRNINLFETHIPFEGTPKRHQHDKSKIILVDDPFSDKKIFYEFSIDTIGMVEELGTITSEDGKSAIKVRIWIKKGSLAIKYEPFIIE